MHTETPVLTIVTDRDLLTAEERRRFKAAVADSFRAVMGFKGDVAIDRYDR